MTYKVGCQRPLAESEVKESKMAMCALESWNIQLKVEGQEIATESGVSMWKNRWICTGTLKNTCWGPGDKCPKVMIKISVPQKK